MLLNPPRGYVELSIMGSKSVVINSDGTATATDPDDISSLLSSGWSQAPDNPSDTRVAACMRLDLVSQSQFVVPAT